MEHTEGASEDLLKALLGSKSPDLGHSLLEYLCSLPANEEEEDDEVDDEVDEDDDEEEEKVEDCFDYLVDTAGIPVTDTCFQLAMANNDDETFR